MLKKLILLMFLCSTVNAATYYVATDGSNGAAGSEAAPWATFAYAFTHMSAGDTLIVKNGTYTQQMIGIPNGTSGAYTNVKAETNWGVTVAYANALVLSSKQYIRIEGIHFDGNNTGGEAGNLNGCNHIKLIRCSFSNAGTVDWNVQTCSMNDSSYVLLEECFAWSTGRYKFLAYKSDHIIYRRCVARHDYHPSHQCAPFARYDSVNLEYQNCIAIDSGLDDNSNGMVYGGIWNPNSVSMDMTGKNLGCIVLNMRGLSGINDGGLVGTRTMTDCIVWDAKGGIGMQEMPGYVGNFSINHCTVGDTDGESQDTSITWGCGVFARCTGTRSVANSIIINNRSLGIGGGYTVSDYNALYGNLGIGTYVNNAGGTVDHGSSGYEAADIAVKGANDLCAANSNAVNPLTASLLYLPRIEASSSLDGAASDSGDIGATVLYKYGYDETLWGEEGYEVLSSSPLWPFPNEDVIREKMQPYYAEWEDWSHGTAGTIYGDRGFCEDGALQLNGTDEITLTSYIWEYLGNQMPEDIYSETPSVDVTSPTISNVSATVYTSSAVVVYTTNENADIRIDYGTTTGYGANVTSAAYTTSHSIAITGLDSETLYHYRITTKDSTGNTTVSGDYNFTTRGEGESATNTIYVSPTGNDTSGSGTEASPYLTIQRAVNEAQAGDTVLVANGTYAGFRSVNSGTDGSPITIKANGNAVIVNSRNASTLDNINVENTDWVVIDGFISSDSARGGVRCVESDDCIIQNCTVINAEVWGILTGFATRVQVLNNISYGAVQQHGIYVSNSRVANDNPIIRGNICYGNYASGIQLNGDIFAGGDGLIEGALVEGNIAYDNDSKPFSIASVRDSIIRNNLMYNNGILMGAGGIHLAAEPDSGLPSNNNIVMNNTIIEPRIAAIRINECTGNVIFNNLCVGAIGIIDEDGGNYIDNNMESTVDTGYFTDAVNHDYTLATGSPAIDAGVATYNGKSAATLDITGYTRPGGAAYDIGAYEYQSESPEEPATVAITITGVTFTGGISISAD